MTQATTKPMTERIGASALDDVRRRIGWDDDKDAKPFDEQINKYSPLEVARRWAGWNLGDPAWADIIISIYERAGGK